jgi:hypothetical protein
VKGSRNLSKHLKKWKKKKKKKKQCYQIEIRMEKKKCDENFANFVVFLGRKI